MNLFHCFACVVFTAGCAASTTDADEGTSADSAAIIGGRKTEGYPAVMALFAGDTSTGSGALCTATLIAPRVLLTAAHCVSAGEVGPTADFVVFSGEDIYAPDETLEVSSVMSDTAFDTGQLQAGHDIGAVILARPSSVTPVPVNRTFDPSGLVGDNVKLVGYGVSNGAKQTGAGAKRTVSAMVRAVDARLLFIGDGQHDTCQGDSGGPALATIDGVPTIVGVTSFGDAGCARGGYDTRVDRYGTFIASALARGK